MLTEAECKNAICPPDKKQARFTDSGGMYLQVSPGGSKRWFLKYRVDGKEKQLALGGYPDVSLKSARLARDAAKLQKSKGTDPVQARKLDKLKATRNTGDTFKAIALEWYGKQAPNGAAAMPYGCCGSWSAIYSRGSGSDLLRRFTQWSCCRLCTR